jgi:hypothetical protein
MKAAAFPGIAEKFLLHPVCSIDSLQSRLWKELKTAS